MTPYVTVVFARPHPYLTVQLAEQPRDKNGRWAPARHMPSLLTL